MRRPGVRQAAAFALGCALAWPALSQGLFDDNEARRRIELLRQQVEASQKALEDRLGKLESSTGERSALLDLAGQLDGLRAEIARMRGQLPALQGRRVTHPGSSLAPKAQYWIGMAYSGQRDYKSAIAAQRKLLTAWPDSPKAPDAMLSIASAQETMGDRRAAQKTLEELIAR